MEVKNSLTQQSGQKKLTFSQALETDDYKKLINTTLRDSKRANRFVAAVVAAVSATPALQDCSPSSILSAALQGEALELSPSPTLGEYFVVPYKKRKQDSLTGEWKITPIAKFQLGVNGRRQLALRSGEYNDIDTRVVRQGEYKGVDKVGRPLFSFYATEEEAEGKEIIGYMAYYETKQGYIKAKYMTVNEALKRAQRSESFDLELYKKFKEGKALSWKEQNATSAPWYQWFDKQAQNACLKDLLGTARKSIEMRTAEEYEEKNENTIAEVFATPTEAQNDFFEASEEQPLIESNETEGNVENNSDATEEKKETKTRKKKEETETAEQTDFFQQ